MSKGSRDLILSGLGGIQRAPGTPYLHTAPVPASTSITPNAPFTDGTSVSEETITYSLQATPFPQEEDGAPRSEQLISPGDILFGTRAGSDPRVGVFTLDYVNIILQYSYLEYRKLILRKIKSILMSVQRANNVPLDWMKKLDFSSVAEITLNDLMTKVDYYPSSGGTSFTTHHNCIPSQINLFTDSAKNNQITPAKKARFKLPSQTDDGQKSLYVGLTHLLEQSAIGDSDAVIGKMTRICERELNRAIGRELVKNVFASFPEITQFLTIDGILSKFNPLGIMVSSQEDTDLSTIQDRGGIRNLNIGVRGPLRIMNFWANSIIKGVHLSLIITRARHQKNNSWGAFEIRPYWSVVDKNGERLYSTCSSIGPVDAKQSRLDIIPAKELIFKDLSGMDAFGHPIQIGDVRYPVGDMHYGTSRIDVPQSIKASALGLNLYQNEKNPILTTVRKAFADKQKLPMIDVYVNM